jgi:hypothetical protein
MNEIKTITAEFYETKVTGNRVDDSGLEKKVTDIYVFDALSFTEAENNAIEQGKSFFGIDFKVSAISIAPYSEVFFSNNPNEGKWYKVKVAFITIDEKTAKERKQKITYLVQGSSVETARNNVDTAFPTSVMDYEIISVSETNILDVVINGKQD